MKSRRRGKDVREPRKTNRSTSSSSTRFPFLVLHPSFATHLQVLSKRFSFGGELIDVEDETRIRERPDERRGRQRRRRDFGWGGGRSSWGERSSDCFTTPSRVGEVDMLIGKWTREILRKEGSRIASGRKEGDVGRREGRGDASSSSVFDQAKFGTEILHTSVGRW